jgi:two-component system, OmpR family, phosphate regulon sensor histidine kinase PhoR
MNGYRSSAKPFSERELDLQRVSDFHAVLLGMAAHDLRQPLQVIQNTYEWLNGRFDAEVDRMRLQRGERAVARLAEQLDQLAAALRLYQHTTTMELSPVPLAPLFDSVGAENVEFARQKGIELRVRPTRAAVLSNAVILDGIVRNLVRNAIKYTAIQDGSCCPAAGVKPTCVSTSTTLGLACQLINFREPSKHSGG